MCRYSPDEDDSEPQITRLRRQTSLSGTPDTTRHRSQFFRQTERNRRRASYGSVEDMRRGSMDEGGTGGLFIEPEQISTPMDSIYNDNPCGAQSPTSFKTEPDYYLRKYSCRRALRQTPKSILHHLVDIDVKKLLFSDYLITNSTEGKEVGDFRVNVGYGSYQGDKLYNVAADSHGIVDGVACGTSIRAWVDSSLRTIEQKHTEYVKLPNHEMERITTIQLNEDKSYTIVKTTIQGEDKQTSTKTYSEQQMHGFISEGSNIILLRLMIKVGIRNSVRFLTMDSNAELCHSTYHVVNKNECFDVHGIERLIDTAIPTVWMNFFMSDGHLASRVQVGSPIVMNLCELPSDLLHADDKIEKPTFSKKDLSIDDDMQLNSMYIERKSELKNDYLSYMDVHPEIKCLLSDFVQHLLMKKPECCITEARAYFTAFDRSTSEGCPQMHSDNLLVEHESTIKNKIKDLMRILS